MKVEADYFFYFSLSFSIDSRLDIAVAASPGGDIAEFVHAVAAFEHVNQIKLTSEEIGRLFPFVTAERSESLCRQSLYQQEISL